MFVSLSQFLIVPLFSIVEEFNKQYNGLAKAEIEFEESVKEAGVNLNQMIQHHLKKLLKLLYEGVFWWKRE